jgi:hypothetical protein
MNVQWSRSISTKAAILAVVIISVMVIGYTSWKAMSVVREIEKHSLRAQMIEAQIFEEVQAR